MLATSWLQAAKFLQCPHMAESKVKTYFVCLLIRTSVPLFEFHVHNLLISQKSHIRNENFNRGILMDTLNIPELQENIPDLM